MQSFPVQPTYNCHYCANQFNAAKRSPFIICNNNHQICLQCLGSLSDSNNCRVCRFPIDINRVRPNNELIKILASSRNANYAQPPQGLVYQQNNQVPTRQISYESKNARAGGYSAYNDINAGGAELQHYPEVPTPAQQNISQNHALQYQHHCFRDFFYYCFNPAQKQVHFIPQVLVLIQLLMSIVNFLIAGNAQRSDCLDKTLLGKISLRSCFFITFYVDLAIVAAMIFVFILFRRGCIQEERFCVYMGIFQICSVLKLLIWGGSQIKIFGLYVGQMCNGGLYGWQLVTVIFHYITAGTLLLVLAVVGICSGRCY